jgi:hypothetical protein
VEIPNLRLIDENKAEAEFSYSPNLKKIRMVLDSNQSFVLGWFVST